MVLDFLLDHVTEQNITWISTTQAARHLDESKLRRGANYRSDNWIKAPRNLSFLFNLNSALFRTTS